MKKILFKFVVILFVSLFTGCDDFDDNLKKITLEDVIQKDSELFNLLKKATKEGDNPTEVIVCLDFIYPFTIIVYDSNLMPINNVILTGDVMFSDFLASFPANQSISISYPISTSLSDGTVFSVNSNAELKLALDSCSKEDIINYCNNLFGSQNELCIWKSSYIENFNNKYAGGIFDTNGDGTLNFLYNNESYNGTWIFLFVNDKLHLNINLAGNSEIATYWNIDREIEIEEESITILNNPEKIFLQKQCQTSQVYSIGNQGPAGGIVFYDKGSYSLGWRYMEASPEDLTFFEWGCMNSNINNTNNSSIGKGLLNSILITNFHDNLNNFYTNPSVCNSLNNGTVVAKKTMTLEINNFDDWFLPSKDELEKIYLNLKTQNIGNLSNSKYWSSTQINESNVHVIDFSNGLSTIENKIPILNNIKTRAVRYF
jgi:hypothetical protein